MNYNKLMNLYFGIYDKIRHNATRKAVRNKSLKRINNIVQLTKEQKKKILDFYAPYEKITTLFHQMYFEKTGVFSEKFIPVDVYINVIDEYFNARKESRFIDNKCYYRMLFNGIKQPEFAVMRCGGLWYNSSMELVSYNEALNIVSKEEELFVKIATDSLGGKGVKYISQKGNIQKDFSDFVSGIKGDLIAQRAIKQHKDMANINESSVNTIRIISLLTEDGPKIYSGIFRTGLKGKKVDNYSSGGVTVGINEDGTLKKYAYNEKGERFIKHPSNDLNFEGYKLPGYDKAREVVMKAHPMIPHFKLVSFDIAIDESGEAILIEANLSNGSLEIHEFNNGPLFGDDTKKILDEVYGIK